jgi:hypothetical protein
MNIHAHVEAQRFAEHAVTQEVAYNTLLLSGTSPSR